VIVVSSLLLVAWLMTPAMVAMVARRRFPALERRGRGTRWQGLVWSLACTLAAVVALVLSIPLWLVPPLVLILPPLIWGWLTYRVLAFDALAEHATPTERRQILHASSAGPCWPWACCADTSVRRHRCCGRWRGLR
jgi:cobalamin biosynthesis protein CobD/CbiB